MRIVTADDRARSALAVILVHLGLGYAFLSGLRFDLAAVPDKALKLFDVVPHVPPPVPEPVPPRVKTRDPERPHKEAAKDPEGAAAPPNLRSRATQIVAPPPAVRLPIPPPITAAPIASDGGAATSGAAPVRGPGTGAGGQGTGTGSGARGGGGGGGGGSGVATGLRWLSGRIRDSDYPEHLWDAGIGGTVYLRLTIATDGRVSRCLVTRSSGVRELDDLTCRLLRKRLRYRPARDAYGRPVPTNLPGEHEWRSARQPDRWVEPEIEDD